MWIMMLKYGKSATMFWISYDATMLSSFCMSISSLEWSSVHGMVDIRRRTERRRDSILMAVDKFQKTHRVRSKIEDPWCCPPRLLPEFVLAKFSIRTLVPWHSFWRRVSVAAPSKIGWKFSAGLQNTRRRQACPSTDTLWRARERRLERYLSFPQRCVPVMRARLDATCRVGTFRRPTGAMHIYLSHDY